MSRNIDVTRLIRWLNTSVLGPAQRSQLANYLAVESPTLDVFMEEVCEIEACLSEFSKFSEKASYIATCCDGVYSKEAIAKVRSTIDGLRD